MRGETEQERRGKRNKWKQGGKGTEGKRQRGEIGDLRYRGRQRRMDRLEFYSKEGERQRRDRAEIHRRRD
jgi:hypothetical protein